MVDIERTDSDAESARELEEIAAYEKWRDGDIELQRARLMRGERPLGDDILDDEKTLGRKHWDRDFWDPVEAWFLVNDADPPDPASDDYWERVAALIQRRGDEYLSRITEFLSATNTTAIAKSDAVQHAHALGLCPRMAATPSNPGMVSPSKCSIEKRSLVKLIQDRVRDLSNQAAYNRIARAGLTETGDGIVFDQKCLEFLNTLKPKHERRFATSDADEIPDYL